MKLFFREYGNGPALIILHGLFGSSDNWTTVAKKLSGSFRVILPDQRNHGQSPHSEEHTYELMSEDIHELAASLGLDKFFLAGHSMGGKTAITFALKWPEMLNGLCIADISPFKADDQAGSEYNLHLKILQFMLRMDLSKISSRADAEKELLNSGLPEYVHGFILKNLQRTADSLFSWKLNVSALLHNLDKIMEPVERREAYSHRVTGFPVLFLKGEKSEYLPEEDFDDILKIFPAAEFLTIRNAGHWIHAENPDEVAIDIMKLLS